MSAFDEYLATVPEPQRAELERIRQVVRDELAGFDLSKGTNPIHAREADPRLGVAAAPARAPA